MKAFLILCLLAVSVAAQEKSADSGGGGFARSVTAAGQFFDHDFVNLYVFGNGVWDSRTPTLSSTNSTDSSLGWEAGGGVTASHQFKGGNVTLNYRGSYRHYTANGISGGNQQSLALSVTKRLGRRWTLGTNVDGGILSYGTSYYSASSVSSGTSSNPFSSESRFLDAGVNLSYNQTRRLSYVFGGSYFLSNYNYANAFSSYGGAGTASMLYRTSPRTTVGLNYSHTYYTYSGGTGTSTIDGGTVSFSHQFTGHYQLDLSGGVNHSHSKGNITIPVSTIFNGQNVTGYYVGPYERSVLSPAFQGVLTRFFRHQSLAVGGGESVLPGNGLFLTSRNQFGTLTYSYSTRRSNLSLGGSYTRLASLANNIASTYSTTGVSASYGINLVRYLSANFRYDFIHYDGFGTYGSVDESRVTFGLSLSTKSVPLTLF